MNIHSYGEQTNIFYNTQQPSPLPEREQFPRHFTDIPQSLPQIPQEMRGRMHDHSVGIGNQSPRFQPYNTERIRNRIKLLKKEKKSLENKNRSLAFSNAYFINKNRISAKKNSKLSNKNVKLLEDNLKLIKEKENLLEIISKKDKEISKLKKENKKPQLPEITVDSQFIGKHMAILGSMNFETQEKL